MSQILGTRPLLALPAGSLSCAALPDTGLQAETGSILDSEATGARAKEWHGT